MSLAGGGPSGGRVSFGSVKSAGSRLLGLAAVPYPIQHALATVEAAVRPLPVAEILEASDRVADPD